MLHFAYAPFSMTGAEAMSFRAVVRNPLMDASLCLRFVQHDRRCYAKHLCHSGHRVMAGTFCVIPSAARNPVWMLHFAYAPFSMTRWCHSERSFLSFQVLFFVIPSACEEFRAMWMLHCAQHDKMVDASLCFAPFSMTVHLAGE